MAKKIIMTGATGLIGKLLCSRLINRGDEVTVFTSSAVKAKSALPPSTILVEWDYKKLEQWKSFLEGKDAVIHLAGENLFKQRWTDEFKSKIIESRRVPTGNLAKALINLQRKPECLISASAIGIYGETGNQEVNEAVPPGEDFLSEVCKIWEKNASLVETSGIRRVSLRTGVVLSTKEGALHEMLTPFKFFVGGPLGTGRQWFSWIHLLDAAEGYIFALDNKTLHGPVNLSSPNPVRMKEFAETLGEVLNRPALFNVPKFVIRLAVGESADVVTCSQKIIPEKLIKSGFPFRFPHLKEALTDIISLKG